MGVRVTPAERAEIIAAAEELGVSCGALMRAGALGAARAGPALLAQEAVAVHRAAGALAAVGRNLNQIARALNEGREVEADHFVVVFDELVRRVDDAARAHRNLVTAHARRGRMARAAAASEAS